MLVAGPRSEFGQESRSLTKRCHGIFSDRGLSLTCEDWSPCHFYLLKHCFSAIEGFVSKAGADQMFSPCSLK